MNGNRVLDRPLSQGARSKPKGGAPRGNRNALKSGRHTAAAIARRRALAAQIAEFRRHVRLVLDLAEERSARRGGHSVAQSRPRS
ncbi:MAG TPA: hypothetical protein VN932_05745 [Rhizomicrobium sp.]|nr:hypothetical protein [Rhizomicrobium sp.]